MEITQWKVDLTGFDADAVPYLLEAANDVRKAEDEVGPLLWKAGQSLCFASYHCPPGQWSTYCERIGISETRARQYQQIFNRFSLAELPKVGKQLLIELAAPSTPEAVIESVEERIESGAPLPTVRELKEEIKSAQAPAPVNHDIDQTKLAPEESDSEALNKALRGIDRAVEKAKSACSTQADWNLLDAKLADLSEDVKNS